MIFEGYGFDRDKFLRYYLFLDYRFVIVSVDNSFSLGVKMCRVFLMDFWLCFLGVGSGRIFSKLGVVVF